MEPNSNTGNATEPQTFPQAAEKSSMGPLIGAAIIILLIIAGGLYLWGSQVNQARQNVNVPPMILGDDARALPPTSSSDAVADINADIEATDLGMMETEIESDMRAVESSI